MQKILIPLPTINICIRTIAKVEKMASEDAKIVNTYFEYCNQSKQV